MLLDNSSHDGLYQWARTAIGTKLGLDVKIC